MKTNQSPSETWLKSWYSVNGNSGSIASGRTALANCSTAQGLQQSNGAFGCALLPGSGYFVFGERSLLGAALRPRHSVAEELSTWQITTRCRRWSVPQVLYQGASGNCITTATLPSRFSRLIEPCILAICSLDTKSPKPKLWGE